MELTPIELENNLGPDANGVVHHVPWVAYDKDEVDQLIAEKDKEIAQLKADLADLWDNKRDTDKLLDERNAEIARLKQELANNGGKDAAHLAIRKLLRALWTVRMKFMWSECRWFSACNPDYIRNREGYTPNSSKEKQMGSLQWARLFYKNYESCKRQVEKFNSRR